METLLPVWSIYKKEIGSDPVEKENFDFIPDSSVRSDYKQAKLGLDSVPGSREFLMNYTFDSDTNDSMPFFDGIGPIIMSSFGNHHSGASATCLGWKYKSLLNDWDAFVLSTKEYYVRKQYDSMQLKSSVVQGYLSADKDVSEILRIKNAYNLSYTTETIATMLDALATEIQDENMEKLDRDEEYRFNWQIGILKFLYKHPSRWNDSAEGCRLFGTPFRITDAMIVAMEPTHPSYRDYVVQIQADWEHFGRI